MTNNDKRTDKKLIERIVISVFIFILFIMALLVYSKQLEKKLNNNIKDELVGISEQNYAVINSVINSKLDILVEISGRISSEEGSSLDQKIRILKEISERYKFKRMGIINKEGIAYSTDEYEFNIKDDDCFKSALMGETCVSGRQSDIVSPENEIIAFMSPIYVDDKIEEVLFAVYSVDELEEVFEIDFFNSQGYFYITDGDGNIILNLSDENEFGENENIFLWLGAYEDKNYETIEEIKKSFEESKSGLFNFYSDSDEKYIYCSPLEVNDWYILNVVSSDAISSSKNYIMALTYALCVIIIIVFVFLTAYMIKSEKEKSVKLREIAYVDSLTGGYTYQRLVEEGIKSLEKNEGRNAAFIVMDIDGFKIVNELYGYDTGDDVLMHIWNIWDNSFDKSCEIFARESADNFIALLYYESREELTKRLEDINLQVQNCYLNINKGYILRPKMGVYLIKDKNEDFKSMHNYAVMAYKPIKGRNNEDIAYYSDVYSKQIIENKFIEDEMEYAYKNNEFIVYYQPKYGAKSCKITGAEALIRWKKKNTNELVSPGRFIPIAEKNGFVTKLDEYVFREVCRQQKELIDIGIEPVPVSVNVSQKHLYYDDFVENYVNIIKKTGIDGKYVQLEITESAMFENRTKIKSIIEELKENNFKILMDDFGTGYSSLMMLKSVPIDVMKLDKSFVDDYNNEKGEMIIRCVISLAKEMDISITAEGVENQAQYEFLKKLDCNDIQGFYFAKPMPAEDFIKTLKQNREK